MSTAEQWAGALAGAGGGSFTLRFDRLGLEAQCRPLNAGEVEECLRMGGEKGLRYALYLSCDELRQAGENLKKQGALASAFDITERLSYGDVVAAGSAILRRSGADTSAVRLETQEGEGWMAAIPPESGGEWMFSPSLESAPSVPAFAEQNQLFEQRGWEIRDFVDRLSAAAGNR